MQGQTPFNLYEEQAKLSNLIGAASQYTNCSSEEACDHIDVNNATDCSGRLLGVIPYIFIGTPLYM